MSVTVTVLCKPRYFAGICASIVCIWETVDKIIPKVIYFTHIATHTHTHVHTNSQYALSMLAVAVFQLCTLVYS